MNISNYNIIKPIYESANSVVYRGRRNEDNQPIILKMLKEDYPTPAELTRYQQEYEITHNFDLAGVIFIAFDENRKVTLVNRTGCEFFECTEKQIANKKLPNFIPFEQPKEAVHTPISCQQVFARDNEPVKYFESQFLSKSGKLKIIALQNVILRGKNRRIIGGFYF